MKPEIQNHLHRLLLLFVCISMTACAFRIGFNVILSLGLLYFLQLQNILLQIGRKIWFVILATTFVDCIGIGMCIWNAYAPQEVFQLAKGYKAIQIIGAILTGVEIAVKVLLLWLMKTEKRQEIKQELPKIFVNQPVEANQMNQA